MQKFLKMLAAGVASAVVSAPVYAAIDYSAAATSATAEVNGAIGDALPVGILVLSAVIGWRLFKRFAKG